MKKVINNEYTKNQPLEFEENFWTGRRTITYAGIPLERVKNNKLIYSNGEQAEEITVKGNQFVGINLYMFGTEIAVERGLNWYEILMSVLVFLPCFLFGLIGGLIGGILGATNLLIVRQIDKWYLKVIVAVLFLTAGMLLSYVLAVLALQLIKF